MVFAREIEIHFAGIVVFPLSLSGVVSKSNKSLSGNQMKYLIVTGGVLSGLGKGITISSLGLLLKSHGLNVTSIKIDPYLV